MGFRATIGAARIDRKIRKEARALLRETRSALAKKGDRVPTSIHETAKARADELARALEEDDGRALRAAMRQLDEIADEHLAFARKSTAREYAESIGLAILIAALLRGFVVEAFKIPSGSMIPTMEIGDHIFVNKFIYGIRVPFTNTKLVDFQDPQRGEVIVFENPCASDKDDFIKRIVAGPGDTVEVRCNILYVNGEPVSSELAEDEVVHWDHNEATGEWREHAASLHRETLGGSTFHTLYDVDRPAKDARIADDPDAPYSRYRDHRDFPDDRAPMCSPETYESEAERERARGDIETVPAEAAEDGPCGPQRHYVVPEGHVFTLGDNRQNSRDSREWGPVPIENIKGRALFIWYSSKPAKAGGVQWDRIGDVVE